MTTQLETTLYERDFTLWIETTVGQLKERDLEQLDWENLIEEIEALGRSEKQALKSNLRILLMHLLKWKYQPSRRSNSWDLTITEHRLRIRDAFSDSPSLKRYFEQVFEETYQDSRKLASKETSLPLDTFPLVCLFSQEDVLNPDYLPD